MYDAAIAGAGPAGLQTAIRLQQLGLQAIVMEEHKDIGKPVHCTGLVSKTGYEDAEMNVDEAIQNEVRGAKMFSPKGTELVIQRNETVAYVLDREQLDKLLAKRAEKAGTEIRRDCMLVDISGESVFVKEAGKGQLFRAKTIVGADGVVSRVRQISGIDMPKTNFVLGYQVRAKGDFDTDFVELHFGDYAKNFFAWVVPESKKVAKIGLATASGNSRKSFEDFLKAKNLDIDIIEFCGGVIPVGAPLKKIVNNNALLVGDSAFQTKATTGGGIVLGMLSGNEAAKSIANYLTKGESLKNYQQHVSHIRKDLEIHWKARKYLNLLEDTGKLEGFFQKIKAAGAEQFLSQHGDMDRPTRFVGRIWTQLGMLRLLPDIIKFFTI